MAMLRMLKASAACVALVVSAGSVQANDYPEDMQVKFLSLGNTLIDNAVWPVEGKELKFKSLVIGQPFNSADEGVLVKTGNRSLHSVSNQPYVCKFNAAAFLPVLFCEIVLWNDASKYPEALQALQTAFGEKVDVELEVILDKPPTLEGISNKQLGAGRLSVITVSNEKPTDGFDEKAVAYFTKQFNAEPDIQTHYRRPKEVYSKACVKSVAAIKNKPRSELSINEQNDLAQCNNEAKAAVLAGKAVSGRTEVYKWSGNGQRATFVSRITKSYGAKRRESKISLSADFQSALELWSEQATKAKKLWEDAKNQSEFSDF